MSDISTRALTCADCGIEIFKTGLAGPYPKRCPGCARKRASLRSRASKALRYRAGQARTYTCEECQQEFPRPSMTGNRKFCDECLAARRRRRSKEQYRALHPEVLRRYRSSAYKAEKAKRPAPQCLDCSATVDVLPGRRPPQRCELCRSTRNQAMRNAWKRAKTIERAFTPPERDPKPCEECGEKFNPFWKGVDPRWCRRCRSDRRCGNLRSGQVEMRDLP